MRIRSANKKDAKSIANIHIDSWRTNYKKIIAKKYLNNLSVRKSTRNIKKDIKNTEIISLVAENEAGQVVGYLFGGNNRYKEYAAEYDYEIYGIYIDKAYQDQSYGEKLIRKFFSIINHRNIVSVCAMFIAGSNLEHFYYELGARYICSVDYRIGEHMYLLHSYGWKNIKSL